MGTPFVQIDLNGTLAGVDIQLSNGMTKTIKSTSHAMAFTDTNSLFVGVFAHTHDSNETYPDVFALYSTSFRVKNTLTRDPLDYLAVFGFNPLQDLGDVFFIVKESNRGLLSDTLSTLHRDTNTASELYARLMNIFADSTVQLREGEYRGRVANVIPRTVQIQDPIPVVEVPVTNGAWDIL